MAMFLAGLEETPYSGWTLSGMASCGHRLFLSGGQLAEEFDSLSNWTNDTATVPGSVFPTTKYGRLVWNPTVASQIYRTIASPIAGNFDVRWDLDTFWQPGRFYWYLRSDTGNMVYTYSVPGNTIQVKYYNGSYVTQYTSSNNWPKPSGVRFVRSGDVFRFYNLDPATNTWSQPTGASDINFSAWGSLSRIIFNIPAGNAATDYLYFDSMRNVVPTVTSGTATSPTLDTVDGLRGFGWYVDSAGTGTVAVDYQTSSDGSNWTGWTSATAWAPITPSGDNRYVKVRVSITGGSTSAASPEVGPIMVNGSIDQATATNLFKHHLASLLLHSNSLYKFGYSQVPASNLAWMSRPAIGISRWLRDNGDTLSWHGTTTDLYGNTLVPALVTGLDTEITYLAANAQLNVEAAISILPSLWEARSVLLPASSQPISDAQKTAWSTAMRNMITSIGNNNWYAFEAANKQLFKRLRADDPLANPGQWTSAAAPSTTTYADSDCAAELTSLAGYISEGSLADTVTSTVQHYADQYSPWMEQSIISLLKANPSFNDGAGHTATTLQSWLYPCVRFVTRNIGRDGWVIRYGRSQNFGYSLAFMAVPIRAAELAGSGYAAAREVASWTVWRLMRTMFDQGFGWLRAIPNIQATTGSINGDTVTTDELSGAEAVGHLGVLATADASFWAASPPYLSYGGAEAYPGWGVATAIGDDATYPRLMSQGTTGDIGTAAMFPYYNTTRMIAERFALNHGLASTNLFSPHGAGFYYTDSGQSSGNRSSLAMPTAASTVSAVLGRASAVYMTGPPSEFSATVAGTKITAHTLSQIVWMRGRHMVVTAKLSRASGSSTVTNYGFCSPAVPVAAGASLGNTDTDSSTYYYGEQPTAQQSSAVLSIFGQGLSGNLQGAGVPRINQAFGLTNTWNQDWIGGVGVDLTQSSGHALASGTPLYASADFAFSVGGSMTPATEAARIGSFARSGDVVTFTYDPDGTPENVYLAFTGQTDPAVGSYTITGTVKAFTGKTAAADWWGVDNATLVAFSGQNQARLASAGKLAIYKLDDLTTRVWSSGSDTTIYAIPSGTITVYGQRWDGAAVDVTADCTVTTGTSVLIPSATVSAYADGGIAIFDIQGTAETTVTAVIPSSFALVLPPGPRYTYRGRRRGGRRG